MSKFCSQCGDPLNIGQKFCEKCGAKVEINPNTVTYSTQNNYQDLTQDNQGGYVQPIQGGLFDQSRNFYILKEKYWDWGSGDIQDEKGANIGRMHRKLLSIRKRIELQELDGSVSAFIHSKLFTIFRSQDLKDPQGNHLARIEKTVFSFFRPKFYLRDPMGQRIMVAQGRFAGFSFTVTDLEGRLIATIQKADKWRDLFLGGIFDFKDTYALKIEDPNVDRRLLVGFVIGIDNAIHDNRSGGFGGIIGNLNF